MLLTGHLQLIAYAAKFAVYRDAKFEPKYQMTDTVDVTPAEPYYHFEQQSFGYTNPDESSESTRYWQSGR